MILVLSDLWLPFPGGAERLMFNVARDLWRRGQNVEVVTGYENAQQFDGPPVRVGPIGIGKDHDAGWDWIGFLSGGHYRTDVILTHHLYAHEFQAELVATGVPLVQIVLNGQRIPEAALAVYISRFVRRRSGDARDGDLVLTPPAFPDVVAEAHGDAIGFVKPIPHKGIELLYEVAAALPDRRFVVLRGEWQDLEVIRPAPNIEFMEPQADIRDFYAQCRLVLVPSLSEDAGTVAQEATLNGLPCLSSNVEGLRETNGGGILLHPEGRSSWVRAIRRLDNPREYRRAALRQAVYLRATNHGATLDELAERIGAL